LLGRFSEVLQTRPLELNPDGRFETIRLAGLPSNATFYNQVGEAIQAADLAVKELNLSSCGGRIFLREYTEMSNLTDVLRADTCLYSTDVEHLTVDANIPHDRRISPGDWDWLDERSPSYKPIVVHPSLDHLRLVIDRPIALSQDKRLIEDDLLPFPNRLARTLVGAFDRDIGFSISFSGNATGTDVWKDEVRPYNDELRGAVGREWDRKSASVTPV
jgi:hypothetical protein